MPSQMPPAATRVDRRGRRLKRTGTAVAALFVISVGVAACGRGSPGVASLGKTTSTTAAVAQGGSSSTDYSDAVAYATCMRSHGVLDFPDPDGQGVVVLDPQTHEEFESPQGVSANRTCEHLLPNGGQPTAAQSQEELAEGVKYAECMRTHGLPTYPDPTMRNGRMILTPGNIPPSVATNSPANQACQALLPQGIPGSVAVP